MMSEVRVRTRIRPTNGRKFILVANSKGGSGKSTLATNLAAAYARLGFDTSLVDCDQQRSSLAWMEMRPAGTPPITAINGSSQSGIPQLDWALRVSPDTSRVIVDSPGGMRDQKLHDTLQKVDDILVPVLPSVIDIQATTEFLKEIYISPGFRASSKRVFVVGNKVEKRNKYFHRLNKFLQRMGEHEVMTLPDSYVFLRCADEGLGVADLNDSARYQPAKQSVLNIINEIELDKSSHG